MSPESGSVHVGSGHSCSVSTPHTPTERGPRGAVVPPVTTEDRGCCWTLSSPCRGQLLTRSLLEHREARLALFCMISCVVSIRIKKSMEVWMQNSQVWNSAHTWKTRLTRRNNATVFVTHGLGDVTTENNWHILPALLARD